MVTPGMDEARLGPEESQEASGGLQEATGQGDTLEAGSVGAELQGKATTETTAASSATPGAAEGIKPSPQQTPDDLTQLKRENTRLSQEAAQRQAEIREQRIQAAAVTYSQNLTEHYKSQGIDEETAKRLSVAETRAQVAEYIAKQATLRSTAMELSSEYGIPRQQLDDFRDETAMRQFAQTFSQTAGPQAQRIAALEKQVAQLTKGRVPAQQYVGGGQARGGRSYAERLKQGGPMPSAEEIDRMTAKYLK